MTTHRKLAAILSADAAGYSRLMADDEAATLRSLNDARALFRERIQAHGGRLIDTAGDSILAEFPSAVEAVDCAVEIQHELAKRNSQLAEHRRMQFRIGINLGDVIEQEDGTIYGDGVNVAARLQTLAEPGGICISGTVYDQVEGKLPLQFKFIGEQPVKNIAKPVRAYRVLIGGEVGKTPLAGAGKRRRIAIGAAAFIAVMVAVSLVWKAQKLPGDQVTVSNDLALAMPTGPAIAVLPFTNMSGDPKQDFFADGITEQLITELSRFRNLYVIARNSTFAYKGRAMDIRQVGRELNARYVVEGSVQRRGDEVRVNVQLLDATSGAHLWAESYERSLKNAKVFGVQDDITTRVVSAIGDTHGAIFSSTFEQSAGKGTTSLGAYECVLHSYAYWRVITPAVHLTIRDCLERAVQLDPRYAEAWASLARMYVDEYSQGFNSRPDPLGRAISAAERAVELDPRSQLAYMSLAVVHFFRHEIDAFNVAADRAIALNPNSADTLAWAGIFVTYANQGSPSQRSRGVAMMRKAIAMSPAYPTWYHFPIAWDYYYNDRYEQALSETRKMNMPGYYWTRALVITIYGALGRPEDAKADIAALLELKPNFPKTMREETRKWNTPEHFISRNVANLRRAGLDVPDENR
jgi:adenylate cyclase